MMQGYKNAYSEIKRITVHNTSKANALATQKLREAGEGGEPRSTLFKTSVIVS